MKKMRMKYFSFDKIPYLYDMAEDMMLPFECGLVLELDLKIAG